MSTNKDAYPNNSDVVYYTGDHDPADNFLGIGKKKKQRKAAQAATPVSASLPRGFFLTVKGKINKKLLDTQAKQIGMLKDQQQIQSNESELDRLKQSVATPPVSSPTTYDPINVGQTTTTGGDMAAPPVSSGGSGGGGGSIPEYEGDDEPTGALAGVKQQYAGVTVTGTRNKWLPWVLIAAAILLVIFGKKFLKTSK